MLTQTPAPENAVATAVVRAALRRGVAGTQLAGSGDAETRWRATARGAVADRTATARAARIRDGGRRRAALEAAAIAAARAALAAGAFPITTGGGLARGVVWVTWGAGCLAVCAPATGARRPTLDGLAQIAAAASVARAAFSRGDREAAAAVDIAVATAMRSGSGAGAAQLMLIAAADIAACALAVAVALGGDAACALLDGLAGGRALILAGV